MNLRLWSVVYDSPAQQNWNWNEKELAATTETTTTGPPGGRHRAPRIGKYVHRSIKQHQQAQNPGCPTFAASLFLRLRW
ncbi:MAG: hypothetical protein WBE38_13370, partial [Terracidiphilus sp.]